MTDTTEVVLNEYTVAVFMNCDRDNYDGYQPHHELADAGETLYVWAATPAAAADKAFEIGNRQSMDRRDVSWPSDIRSVSVGDLIKVSGPGSRQTFLTVDKYGWTQIPEPANPIRPLAGADRVTSRR